MCAYTCTTVCAMLGCTVCPKLFLPFNFDSLPGSVCSNAIGHHLIEWENILCLLSCTCLQWLHAFTHVVHVVEPVHIGTFTMLHR